ncbi:hypothetical protein Lcho_2601 [Leptothrix cholodnii SP-6]|uniref:Uncharacterized protein n=1 Tax=Leptothrix cholodnii (strain ATCC 51168 / LMG 8142 / SP-6) TaxID=395495 RepID=B1Y7B1_LEPCP|nr:hypothetical protein [Leptothrix cholodnii]ACB34866.1 hypothetical protein Lcho_2601 [Leptothrix cholodnii SP-6]
MLDSLTRLLRRRPSPDTDSRLMEDWARQRGETIKRVRDGSGCVLEFRSQGLPARLEWGPAQRDYIHHRELRVRVELALPEALEMLVMSRALAERLETQAYDQLTRDQQTEIDASMPEEARWLAMFDPVALAAPAAFGDAFLVMAASPPHARRWVEGELAGRLIRARERWLSADAPLVLMTLRGRLYLRTEARALDDKLLEGVRQLIDAAADSALRVVSRAGLRPVEVGLAGLTQTRQPGVEGVPQASLVADPGVSAEELSVDADDELMTNFSIGIPTDHKL